MSEPTRKNRPDLDKLLTAEQVSAKIRVLKPERLLELVKNGYAPHWEIDGQIFFYLPDVKAYIKGSLTKVIGGCPIPLIIEQPSVAVKVPKRLAPAEGLLYRVPAEAYRSGVYFLIHKGEVVYVGQSVGVAARVRGHVGNKLFDDAFYVQVAEDRLDDVEQAFIRFFSPALNIVKPAGTFAAQKDDAILAGFGFSRHYRAALRRVQPDFCSTLQHPDLT